MNAMATFGRLLGFLRPYRRGLGCVRAARRVALTMTAAIPWLTGRAIDQMREGDRVRPDDARVAVLGAGVLRMALTVARRLIAGRVSLGVELDLRTRMYATFQSLELAFFDRQQTGQLMSRATVDLQSVRFFLGYGLIFMLQSGADDRARPPVAMFLTGARLAAISLAPVPVVVFVAARYGRIARPALQEVQQRIAELTADVEENVGGVRVGRRSRAEHRSSALPGGRGRASFDQAMVTTRLAGVLQPVQSASPQVGLARSCSSAGAGGHQRRASRSGSSGAFYYATSDAARRRCARSASRLRARPAARPAAGARLFQVLDRCRASSPRDRARRAARRQRPASSCARRHARVRRAARRPRMQRRFARRARRARRSRSSAPPGSGKTTLVQLIPRPLRRHRRRRLVDGADVRDVDVAALRHAIASSTTTRSCSRRRRENIAYARADASPRTSSAPPAARRRTTSSSASPTATTRASASAGSRSRRPAPARRDRARLPRRPADPDPRRRDVERRRVHRSRRSRRRCARSWPGRTTFVIAHRLSTISLADEIVVLEDGELLAHGTHDELLEASALYREIVEKGLPDQVFLTRKPRERKVAGL
jgi:ATP-binding cassette subfamily B protein